LAIDRAISSLPRAGVIAAQKKRSVDLKSCGVGALFWNFIGGCAG
jgi:hypothetical protein